MVSLCNDRLQRNAKAQHTRATFFCLNVRTPDFCTTPTRPPIDNTKLAEPLVKHPVRCGYVRKRKRPVACAATTNRIPATASIP